ncbi:MAG: carbohydrate-binding domain-containing protein, partial [Eubacterium sp.]|nr:carbohydrate-binding domain-containing protein [Eubacterium sp.]
MNIKKITAILISAALLSASFTACSSKNADDANATTAPVVEVTDADDHITVAVDEDEDTTIELIDKDGNVLTLVPIYNSDGVTVIAGYIESAKSKDGKVLTQQEYTYIKGVVALDIDAENNFLLKYTSDNKLETIKAISDSNGYIIAIQDVLDLDKDKDVEEYFKVVTKFDANKNLFIKLDKDDKGKLVNVTVEEKKDENTGKTNVTVIDPDGKKTSATVSTDAKNLGDVVKEEKDKQQNQQKPAQNQGTSSGGNSGNNGGSNNTGGNDNQGGSEEKPTEPDVKEERIDIVLQDNGKVACDADNITVNGNLAAGGTELIVDGPGEYSKYYVTSETGTFYGKIEFRFSVEDNVEVKFNNVNMSSGNKTAVKFTNVDSEVDKETDGEEIGVGGNTGTTATNPAPKVELSITGANSFKASGSGKNGTIYSECKLAIKGRGSAEIDGGPSLSGICSTESITIKNASLDIVSRGKQGISCDKKVTVDAGATLNIESRGDGIHCNKFEFNGSAIDGSKESTINIRSM